MELKPKSVKIFNEECQRNEWYDLTDSLQVEVEWTWWGDETEHHPLMQLAFFLLNNEDFPLGRLRILCLNPQTMPLLDLNEFNKEDWIMFCEDYRFNYQAAPTFSSTELREQGIYAYLDEVYIGDDYRNLGLATQLIEFVKGYLYHYNLSKGILTYPFAVEHREDTIQVQRVQKLYTRLGFEPWQMPYYCFSH